MFGLSAGGFNTLAIIGGVADHTKIGPMRREHPGDFACQLVARSAGPVAIPVTLAVADARVKSAVIAAPALGFTFSPDGGDRDHETIDVGHVFTAVGLTGRRARVRAPRIPATNDGEPSRQACPAAEHAPCGGAGAASLPATCRVGRLGAVGVDRSASQVTLAQPEHFLSTMPAPGRDCLFAVNAAGSHSGGRGLNGRPSRA